MFFILEIDKKWCGIGFDIYKKIIGIRIGFIALHLVLCSFQELIIVEKEIKKVKYDEAFK